MNNINRIYIIYMLATTILVSSCTTLVKSNNQTDITLEPDKHIQDTQFDLNINSLSYQLPIYTKICTPKTQYVCSLDWCNAGKPVIFVLYNENISKVYRCDNKWCDGYNFLKNISGMYTNLAPVIPNGSLVKLSINN